MIYALLAAAAAVALWPTSRPKLAAWPLPAAEPPRPPKPTYAHAIHALATVRARLAQTDKLGDAERAAIDTATLALVAGSDE